MVFKRGPCRASVYKSLYYLGSHPPGLQKQMFLRAVVQLPRVAPEARPPRANPPFDLVQQGWGFSDGASQIDKRGSLVVLFSRAVEDYPRCRCTRNRPAHDLRLARGNDKTKCTEDFDGDHYQPLQPARRPRQNARVVSIQHPPNSTLHSFQCRFRASF